MFPLLNADEVRTQYPVSEFRYGQFACYLVSLALLDAKATAAFLSIGTVWSQRGAHPQGKVWTSLTRFE